MVNQLKKSNLLKLYGTGLRIFLSLCFVLMCANSFAALKIGRDYIAGGISYEITSEHITSSNTYYANVHLLGYSSSVTVTDKATISQQETINTHVYTKTYNILVRGFSDFAIAHPENDLLTSITFNCSFKLIPSLLWNRHKLSYVNLGDQKIIPEQFCSGCENLATVRSNGLVTEIRACAFDQCMSLKSIPDCPLLKTIGERAFNNCAITGTVEFPSTLDSIGTLAFGRVASGQIGAPQDIKEVICNSTNPPAITGSGYAFTDDVHKNATLYVPIESLELYKNAYEWKEFSNIKGIGEVEASSIALNKAELDLYPEGTEQLSATVAPDDTTNQTIEWSSDDDTIASVSSDGIVTAHSVGTTNIIAKCGAVSTSCKVTVNPILATSISISVPEQEIFVGDRVALSATVQPDNTTSKNVTWSSSDESIAYIDEYTGVMKAIAPGDVEITAKCGAVLTSYSLTIKPILATSIMLSHKDISLLIGQTEQISATIQPTNTTDKSIIWRSDNENVAIVSSDGTVIAKSIGVANITATNGEVSASCRVTVNPIEASNVTLNVENLNLLVGQTETLSATVEPENTTDAKIVWASDDETIATVSEDGIVTAVMVGIANITATCGEVTATCKVSVSPVLPTEITLNVSSVTLITEEMIMLEPIIEPENATEIALTWASSDKAIATVDAVGNVTAIAPGIATITVSTSNGITSSCTITVLAKQSGIDIVNDDSRALVVVDGSDIVVRTHAEVYNIAGVCLAVSDGGRINSLPHGVYIVKVDEQVIKVRL